MYATQWHRAYSDKTLRSATMIIRDMLALFDISSTLEVGCGNAHWTKVIADSGVPDYLALDGPWNKVDELLIERGRYRAVDLSEPMSFERKFSLSICLEVAEHLPPESADTIVKTLTNAADVVLFGAATPYQGGYGHINEQWPSYWREKFAANGYQPYDLVRPKYWNDNSLHYWYRQNIFCYVRRDNLEASARAQNAQRVLYENIVLFDAIHPEKFEETASYRAISLKRLAKQFPIWFFKRITSRLRGY